MRVITEDYKGQKEITVIGMKNLYHQHQDWVFDLDISAAAKSLLTLIIASSRGRDYAWPSMDYLRCRLRKSNGKMYSERTIQRLVKELREKGLIERVLIRTVETLRQGFAILAHPDLVEWVKSKLEILKKKIVVQMRTVPIDFFYAKNLSQQATQMSPHTIYKKHDVVTPPAPAAAKAPVKTNNVNEAEEPKREDYKNFQDDPTAQNDDIGSCATVSGDLLAQNEDNESEKTNNHPVWEKVITKFSSPEDWPLSAPFLNMFSAREENGCLIIETAAPFLINKIRKIEKLISAELQKEGITSFSFSVLSKEQINHLNREAEKKERQKAALIRKRSIEELERRKRQLNDLPQNEQFNLLLQQYPKKINIAQARTTFNKLSINGILPDLSFLLQKLGAEKSSLNWQKDEGRWIPALGKWLNRICKE